jgi:hypothetical protein
MSEYPLRSITYNLEGSMRNTFTIHCLPWEICAPLLEEFRLEASLRRVISHVDALPDPKDAELRHAIAIDAQGRVIGAARLQQDHSIDTPAVMPHTFRDQIASALVEILRDYSASLSARH